MQLTQKQESMISQYLRDYSRQLDSSLPDRTREHKLLQVQTRIYRELEALRRSSISDEDVVAVLRHSENTATPGEPDGPASSPAPRPQAPAGRRMAPPPDDGLAQPIWLGVCAFNAERFGAEAWMVRLGAVLLGVFTGPLALLCYLGAFVEYYLALEPEERPEIDYGTLALRAAGPFVFLVLLRWGAGKVEDLIAYGHDRIVKAPLPPLGDWGWLPYYEPTYFYLAFLTVIPLGILSGLPMANAWGQSLKRLSQAAVALYAVMLSFGLASIIVGIILDRVEVYLP